MILLLNFTILILLKERFPLQKMGGEIFMFLMKIM